MKKKLILSIVIIGIISCFSSILILLTIKMKTKDAITFTDNIAFYINREDSVSMGEFLLYAASVTQSTEKTYGTKIWKENLTLKDGNKISYEEFTKRQITEQIRMTRLLCQKAVKYGVSLTVKEQKSISSDAETYFKSISKYNVCNKEIDLSTVLKVYHDNALAEKVYNHILNSVKNKKEDHFKKEYQSICKEWSPNWTYEKYVNQVALAGLEFTGNTEEDKK